MSTTTHVQDLILLDLDDTLSDVQLFLRAIERDFTEVAPHVAQAIPDALKLRAEFKARHQGLSHYERGEIWARQYPGFSYHHHLQFYEAMAPEAYEQDRAAINEWLQASHNFDHAVYEDAADFLQALQRRDDTVTGLFTFGVHEWQHFKLRNLPEYIGSLPRTILEAGVKGEEIAAAYNKSDGQFYWRFDDDGPNVVAKHVILVDDQPHAHRELPPQATGYHLSRDKAHPRFASNVHPARSLHEIAAHINSRPKE